MTNTKKINPEFYTSLRIAKFIPMVTPRYKSEAILALCSELKIAIRKTAKPGTEFV